MVKICKITKIALTKLLIVAFLITTGTISPALSKSKDKVWVSVPVYYATSREFDSNKKVYSGARSGEHKDHGLEYGIVTTTLLLAEKPYREKTSIAYLGWQFENRKDRKKPARIEKLSREEFFKRLKESHKSTTYDETCLFVHGYNNSFEGAAKSAARLELALREPVILFSWPSKARTKEYTVDECNAEWSERPFQIFAQGLEKEIGSQRLMTVSHSMGIRLVNWYLKSRYDKFAAKPPHFKEIVLTSPDIDRATFKNYFYKLANNGDKVRLFISDKDIPLRLSKFIHGSARTGSGITKGESKWSMPGNITPTQTVNFTAVDNSKIGHSIQYKVIGSMHRNNMPGKGLKLLPDKTFKGDYVQIVRADKESN